jgi:chromosome segregation ATPase
MKNQLGIIVLILIAVGLSVGLIWSQKTTSKAVERIETLSNTLASTSQSLENQKKVNLELENDRSRQKEQLTQLSGSLVEASNALETSQTKLAERDTRISELENQNQALDRRASELTNSITLLTDQIADTRRRLAASEGDKDTLTRELQRLMNDKADLERQLNDITFLRNQVAKLKEENNISRRLDWMRKGLYVNADRKGAEQLLQKSTPAPRQQPSDLDVVITSDGTIKVNPASTNSASATTPAQ